MTGRAFLALHALTDEIASDTRTWVDRVAERAVALGFTVDARPGTVAAVAGQFPAGRVSDHEAIAELVDHIHDVAASARRSVAGLGRADVVGQGVTVEFLEGLEKFRRMLSAQGG